MSDGGSLHRKLPDGRWRRWRMGDLPTVPAPASASASASARAEQTQAAPAAARAATPSSDGRNEELEKLRKAAQSEGYKEGFQQGYRAGEKAGRDAGYQTALEEGREAGLEQGREEGRREVQQRVDEEISRALAPISTLVDEMENALLQLDDEVASALIDLALSIGRQLARDALDAQPEQIAQIVRDLLHHEPIMTGKPRLWLHPEDLALVQEHLGTEIEAAGWQAQADDQISRGGCRVTAPDGELDATWEERWETVSRQVSRRRGRRSRSAGSTATAGSTTTTKSTATAKSTASAKPAATAKSAATPTSTAAGGADGTSGAKRAARTTRAKPKETK